MGDPLLLLIPGGGYLAAGATLTFRRAGHRPALWIAALVYASLATHIVLLVLRDYSEPTAFVASFREAAVSLSGLLVVAYLIVSRMLQGMGALGLVPAVAGLALVLVAPSLPAVPAPVPPILQSAWFLLHVPLCLLSHLMYAMAGCGAVMYLVVSGLLKARRPIALSGGLPSLESLDRFSHRMAKIGFPLLTAGLLAGMLWSYEVWGQVIPEAPKQVAAFASWGVYAAYFHARNARGTRGRFCAWMLVAGFTLALAGLLLPLVSGGPHRFI
jgi:ABC-type transport system involved in cytochrome c biogenesis permease subunit